MPLPEFPDVPIVGQSSKILAWYPTAVVGCYCKGENQLVMLILTGFNNWVACGHCGKHYAIQQIRADGHTMDIQIMLPTAPAGVQ
jgi:hypothetical protein